MPWFKVDDTLAFHRKTVAAGVSAMGLWVRAGSWCAQTLTDGFVPEHMVPALADGDAGLAGSLVEAGLWRRVKGGYVFHEWAQRQPSRQSTEDRRAVRAEAGRIGGVRSGQVRRTRRSKNEASASSKNEASASQVLEPPTRPDPTRPVVSVTLGGNRPVGNARGNVTEPPSEDHASGTRPPDRCAEHRDLDGDPGPCRGCMKAREHAQQWDKDTLRQHVIDVRACTWCDPDGWRINPHHKHRGPISPAVRCDHTPLPAEQLEASAS